MTKIEAIKNEYKNKILAAVAKDSPEIKVYFDDNPPSYFDLERMEQNNIHYVVIKLTIK